MGNIALHWLPRKPAIPCFLTLKQKCPEPGQCFSTLPLFQWSGPAVLATQTKYIFVTQRIHPWVNLPSVSFSLLPTTSLFCQLLSSWNLLTSAFRGFPDLKLDSTFYYLRIYILSKVANFLLKALCLQRPSLSVTSYQPKSALVPGFSWPATSCAIGRKRNAVTLLKVLVYSYKICTPSMFSLLQRSPHQLPESNTVEAISQIFQKKTKTLY